MCRVDSCGGARMFAVLSICQEVQERFPNEWVVLEVTKAYSKEGQRIIEEMSLIDSYEDSWWILQQSKKSSLSE